MHHFIANSPFSAKVYYVNQLQHSRGIPIRSYCAVVSLLTVCLEPVVFVWALLQCGAHFHTFFIEVLQSFPVSVFLIWSQVLLFLSNLLSQFFLILQWIFKKKHSCSFPFFSPAKNIEWKNHMQMYLRSSVSPSEKYKISVFSYRNETNSAHRELCLSCSIVTAPSAGLRY